MRQFAGEQGRWLIEPWEWIQLGLGLSLFCVLLFGERPPKAAIGLCLLMMAFVMAERFGISPALFKSGRATDFLPVDSQSADLRTFLLMRRVYFFVDSFKIGLGACMAAVLILRKPADPSLFARQDEFGVRGKLPRSAK